MNTSRSRRYAWAWSAVLSLAVILASVGAACGGGDNGTASNGSGNPGGGAGSGGAFEGGLPDGSGGTGVLPVDGSAGQTLTIDPQDPVLTVTGTPLSVSFKAKLSDGTTPQANWVLDDVKIGAIDATGKFTAKGMVAGSAQLTATVGNLTATTSVKVIVKIKENQGQLDAAAQAALRTGGTSDPSFAWLYPYDGTIFPKGLRAPVVQLNGASVDAIRVHVAFGDFDYEGFWGASTPPRVELPQTVWDAITQSSTAQGDVVVQVTKLQGGAASGPVQESWKIAQGSLKGIVYYNTYVSASTKTGAVMRIRPGNDAEVMLDGCTVCHAVSAKGNVLVAGVNWANGNPVTSGSWNLAADGTASPRYSVGDGRPFSFGALTPDGDRMVTNAVPATGSPIRGLDGDYPTRLLDTATGQELAAPSLTSAVSYALTPVFSPDGTKLAFNRYDKTPGHTLAILDVDLTQSPPLFSNLRDLVESADRVLAWPTFTPDGKAVLYHEGDGFDTSGWGGVPRNADVRLVDTSTGAVKPLERLNGYNGSAFYLPYGEAEEAHLDYEPSILPVPVGGYYWVVFTSRRAYGNTIAPGGTVAGGDNKWGGVVNGGEVPSPRKKIWIAALDLDHAGSGDPSHPAFYLPGQELEAGNMRAFAALEPCKAQGQSCESGAECCDGFCRQTSVDDAGVPVLECVPPPAGCSNEDEACTTAADCCDFSSGFLCINGRCAMPTPH